MFVLAVDVTGVMVNWNCNHCNCWKLTGAYPESRFEASVLNDSQLLQDPVRLVRYFAVTVAPTSKGAESLYSSCSKVRLLSMVPTGRASVSITSGCVEEVPLFVESIPYTGVVTSEYHPEKNRVADWS